MIKPLERFIYIRHLDRTYDSVDFDDFISTLSYFTKLYQFSPAMDEGFTNMVLAFKMTSEKSFEVQAQHIMRSTAEKIHGALQDLNPQPASIGTTFNFVIKVMLDAEEDFVALLKGY